MNSDRLKKLENYYKQDPNDPFIIYGLALEYEKRDLDKAVEFFDILLTKHPDYLPTYYKAAHLYWEEDQPEQARSIFERGIDLAKKQENVKILNELKAAFHNFQMENDY
ncbi:MAG: tetratricopeptide repeat protein [Candidatus Cyclobacteriaceae bacterium M2_1C_046]